MLAFIRPSGQRLQRGKRTVERRVASLRTYTAIFGITFTRLMIVLFMVQSLTRVAQAGDLTTAVRIGNPLLARYPASGDARPRSIWDMHTFNGRIYIGNGDYWMNSGPTDLWTYRGDGTNFLNEFTVDDEIVMDFFEFENKLFIPGNDATEDWTFENLYINDPQRPQNPGWIKLRTMPGGVHSFDVALFKDKVYASITTDGTTPNRTLVSTDMGQTWTTFLSQYSAFVVFDDFMLVTGTNTYTYDGTSLQSVSPDLLVEGGSLSKARNVRFQDGVLYASPIRFMLTNSPLYFLSSNQVINGGVATAIAQFANENVRDVVVRSNTCYVMTATEIQQDVLYQGRINTSSDLTNWPEASVFTVPGIPLSFEIMSNSFYVGLGSRYEGTNWNVLIGPEAGSVWQVTPAPRFVSIAPTMAAGVALGIDIVPNFNLTVQTSPDLVSTNWRTLAATNVASAFCTFTDLTASNQPIRFYRALH